VLIALSQMLADLPKLAELDIDSPWAERAARLERLAPDQAHAEAEVP
jgi:hypothetical protein